jgi:hypothetical protein
MAIQLPIPAFHALERLAAFWKLSRRGTIEKVLMAEDLKMIRSFGGPEKRRAYMEGGQE